MSLILSVSQVPEVGVHGWLVGIVQPWRQCIIQVYPGAGVFGCFYFLNNNQINAHALIGQLAMVYYPHAMIGQSAMVYCAGKLAEKIARLLNYFSRILLVY